MASPNPNPSFLDQNQIVQRVFDSDKDRLRVETEISTVNISGGSQEILITDDIDSIKIGNGSHQYLAINPDGSINVNIESTPTTDLIISNFNAITSVISGAETPLLTYTAPLVNNTYLQKITVSGSNIAVYDLYLNGALSDRKRTYFGSTLNSLFDFSTTLHNGLKLSPGTLVQLNVTHNRPYLGDFEARIQVTIS